MRSAIADTWAAFDLTGLTPTLNRWGQVEARLDNDRTIRVCEDDESLYVLLLTGGTSQLNAGEVRLSGRLASPVMMAATIGALADA